MKKSYLIILIVIALSFAAGFYFSPQMPPQMVSHWNAQGQPDGFMPKLYGLFLMPVISLILFLLFILIPKIDPLKENVEKFRKYFDGFIVLIIAFLLYIHLLTLAWNVGVKFEMGKFILPPTALLFYFSGVLMTKAKRNFFIGIRTPWTLSSEVVWDKTHQMGGKLFKASGVIALFGIFFGAYAFYFLLVPVMLSTVYIILYSYLEYQKEKKI